MSDFRRDLPFDPFDENESVVPSACDCEWPTAWDSDSCDVTELSAEQQLSRLADDFPEPRAGLRDAFLQELTRVESRRERMRQLPVVLAFMAAALLGIFGPRADSPDAGTAVARNELKSSTLPFLAHEYGPVELIAASREGDSWALVDAYNSVRKRTCDRLGVRVQSVVEYENDRR